MGRKAAPQSAAQLCLSVCSPTRNLTIVLPPAKSHSTCQHILRVRLLSVSTPPSQPLHLCKLFSAHFQPFLSLEVPGQNDASVLAGWTFACSSDLVVATTGARPPCTDRSTCPLKLPPQQTRCPLHYACRQWSFVRTCKRGSDASSSNTSKIPSSATTSTSGALREHVTCKQILPKSAQYSVCAHI